MTTSPRAPSVTIEGTVEAANDRGIRVAGDWYNLSRFRPLELPAVGAEVRLEVDPRGYICSASVVGEAERKTAGLSPAQDERTARLEVLKAAANFVGQLSRTHEEARSEHVLLLADKWLAWVEGPDRC